MVHFPWFKEFSLSNFFLLKTSALCCKHEIILKTYNSTICKKPICVFGYSRDSKLFEPLPGPNNTRASGGVHIQHIYD